MARTGSPDIWIVDTVCASGPFEKMIYWMVAGMVPGTRKGPRGSGVVGNGDERKGKER